MKIALFGKNVQGEDLARVESLLMQIAKCGGSVLIYEDFYKELSHQNGVSFSQLAELARQNGVLETPFAETFVSGLDSQSGVDMLFSLGGDGTLLDTLSVCSLGDIPVLGINLGHLGFLTSVGRGDCENLLEKIQNGLFKIEKHILLKAEAEGITKPLHAINEVCVRSLSPSELLEIEVFVDGEYLSTYSSDGIIAATPTGSTAYSMSCGGPIITPHSKCICLTPISPHNLTHRPLIVPENSKIEFVISHSKSCISLHLDSQNHILNCPAKITIGKAEPQLQLVRMESSTFFSAIRNKLMWGKNLRNAEKE